jgi:hypothetical protein
MLLALATALWVWVLPETARRDLAAVTGGRSPSDPEKPIEHKRR